MFPIFHPALRHLSVVATPQISRGSRTSQRVERKGRSPCGFSSNVSSGVNGGGLGATLSDDGHLYNLLGRQHRRHSR